MARHKVLRSPRSALKERKKAARKAVLLAVLFVLVSGGLWYALSRPEFRIRDIDISGAARVPNESIEQAVRDGMSGSYVGVVPKSHTLFYPKAAIKESLLRDFPALSDVSLSLSSLAALRVSIREREPLALWCTGEQDCFLIDDAGFAFAEAPEGTESLYYRFEQSATTSPLGSVAIEQERLSGIISFLKKLEVSFDPETIMLRDGGEMEIGLAGGTKLLLREGDFARSLERLEVLLAKDDALPRAGEDLRVHYIDLRYGNKIYVKPK